MRAVWLWVAACAPLDPVDDRGAGGEAYDGVEIGVDDVWPSPAADAVHLERVRGMMRHAWGGYEAHAWGRDELAPVSRTGSDRHAKPLGLTIVDALDTLHLMGLDAERDRALDWIREELDVRPDMMVSAFETNIRVLGGLLSGYALIGDPVLLAHATDLGDALLAAFYSPTGLPYRFVNLETGVAVQPTTSAADAGTWVLELQALSRWTGDLRYEAAARAALDTLDAHVGELGLPLPGIDADSGAVTVPVAQVGGGVDSWLEYLMKVDRVRPDPVSRARWVRMRDAVHAYLADETDTGLWYGAGDPITGELNLPTASAMSCSWAGLLALDGDVDRGGRHATACFLAWETFGLLPEAFAYRDLVAVAPSYELRPELAESLFILWRQTGDPVWRERGVRLMDDLDRYCRTDAGYSNVSDVGTMELGDAMPSSFLSETLKYLFLLYADEDAVPLDAWVFNTQGHPLPVQRSP